MTKTIVFIGALTALGLLGMGGQGCAVPEESKVQKVVLHSKNAAGEFMTLAYIPAGEFMMGSPDQEKGRGKDEGPRRRVKISKPFWMGTCEVTNAQFAVFVKTTGYVTMAEKSGGGYTWDATKKAWGGVPGTSWKAIGLPIEATNDGKTTTSDHPPGDWPVVMVSWQDANAFCAWLSKETGQTFSLPTEAQWEYACRAGAETAYFWGGDEAGACEYANIWNQEYKGRLIINHGGFACSDGYFLLSPAGHFKANAWGLHDMIGNVWEWCSDAYVPDYYAKAPDSDPKGPDPAGIPARVLRGGAWNYEQQPSRTAKRNGHPMGTRSSSLGFRVCRTAE